MNPIEYKITLDCRRAESQVIITAKQGEASGRKITFSLNEGRLPYKVPSGVTAVLRAKKPSGAVLYNTCTVTADGNVEYIITTQTVAEVGKLPCELQLSQDGKVIFSPNFTLLVYKNLSVDSEVESSDEFTALQAAISRAESLTDGTTFTPTVSEDGVLSWTNDGGKNNPESVNIKGPQGADGADGTGIQSVVQTTTSTEDGGANVITVTKTDGTSSTFTVRNGSKGSTGATGARGATGATGATGADGKSAYQYAQESGYTGTETEFAEKLAQEQLYGTTLMLTPTQVSDAVSAGIPVRVQYVDNTWGFISFTSFTIVGELNAVVSQTIVYTNGEYILVELFGKRSDNTWSFMTPTLQPSSITDTGGYFNTDTVEGALQEIGAGLALKADKSEIPTALPNPHKLTINGTEYDGSVDVQMTIQGGGGTSDHSQLTNRDAENQHPITAITGLQTALDGKADAADIPSLEGYATEAYVQNYHDNTKQDIITDLATIRSGAALGATAVQPDDLNGYALKSDFVDEEQIIVPAYTNLVDTAGYTDGKLLNSNGAEADSAAQFVTGYIPVTKGDVIRFKPHDNIVTNSSVIVFYDANKTITDGIGKTFSSIMDNATYGAPTITDNTFTINTENIGYYFWGNIAFVRFCAKGGGAGAIVTVNETIGGSTTETKYTLKGEIKVAEENLDFEFPPMLRGRNIVCFGDSILALIRNETGVLAQAAKMTGGNFINCGFGGCRMSQHPESEYDAFSFYQLATAAANNDFSAQDVAAVATGVPDYYPEQLARLKAVNWNEVDEIIVAYGTNDFDANVVIDGSTNSTIIGALKNGLSAILTAYPHIKVNIASTIFRMWSNVGSDVHTNSNGNKLPDVNNALREVAAERKANFIDLYNTCGITTDNASTMLSDGTHPSVVGCKAIGRAYGGGIIKPMSGQSISASLEDMGDWEAVTDVTVSSVVYHTFWKVAPTATNQVYGWAVHPTNGKLYYIYNNKGAYTAADYSANTNTQMRIYRTATNVEVPIGAFSTGTTTSAWAEPSSGSYKAAYGVVCNDTSKRVTMNPSTGKITFNGEVGGAGFEAAVNALIDAKLGVIENGSY